MLKNSVSRYKFFLGLELVVVLAVMGIFRVFQDPSQRPMGGVIAGAIFLISTLAVLGIEWRFAGARTGAFIGGLVFLLASVLPVLLVRALTWGVPFDEAEAFGIPGRFLHKSANLVFLLFLVGIFFSLQKARAQGSRK